MVFPRCCKDAFLPSFLAGLVHAQHRYAMYLLYCSPYVNIVYKSKRALDLWTDLLHLSGRRKEKSYMVTKDWLRKNGRFRSKQTQIPEKTNLRTSIYVRYHPCQWVSNMFLLSAFTHGFPASSTGQIRKAAAFIYFPRR